MSTIGDCFAREVGSRDVDFGSSEPSSPSVREDSRSPRDSLPWTTRHRPNHLLELAPSSFASRGCRSSRFSPPPALVRPSAVAPDRRVPIRRPSRTTLASPPPALPSRRLALAGAALALVAPPRARDRRRPARGGTAPSAWACSTTCSTRAPDTSEACVSSQNDDEAHFIAPWAYPGTDPTPCVASSPSPWARKPVASRARA